MTELTQYEKLQTAIDLAFTVHKNQVRYDKSPYIFHPLAVMMNVPTLFMKTVAILHDVLEDSKIPSEIENRIMMDIGIDELVLVKRLTHIKDMDYMEYINMVIEHPITTEIKIADIEHNLQDLHIMDWDKNIWNRIQKYNRALVILKLAKARFEDTWES